MFQTFLTALCLAALSLPVLAQGVAPLEMRFRLVGEAGMPVKWDDNTITYQDRTLAAPEFKTQVPDGVTLLLDTFVLINKGGVITSPSPDVQIAGDTITVHVARIDHSLRSAGALLWSGGKLYVAEPHSNDGTDHFVAIFAASGQCERRIETVNHPRALAATSDTLFVAGDDELAAFALGSGHKIWTQPLTFGQGVTQMALLGDNLYIGDKSAQAVRIFNTQGKAAGQFSGEGENALKTETGLEGIGVCASAHGTLIVSDGFAVREFDAGGKFLRKIADVRGGAAVACDAAGNFAVAIPWARDPDNPAFSEIWKFDAHGQPMQRLVKVYMRGPAAIDKRPCDEKYKLRYFGGLTSKLLAPGGVAFDGAGRLFVSDTNDAVASPDKTYGTARAMENDGGVIKISADGEFEARWGSRFSDGKWVDAALKRRATRDPLARTRTALAAHGTLRLLAWGDSITQTDPKGAPAPEAWHGGASDHAHNWVSVLGRLLEARFAPLRVVAEADGVGGQNAPESLARNPIGPQSQQPQHDLILIELGTNDQVFHVRTPVQFAAALRAIVTQIFTLTEGDVVLVAPGPIFDSVSAQPPAQYLAAMQQVGRELGVPVVDVNAAILKRLAEGTPLDSLFIAPRNVHPNDAGHAVWAQATLDVLTAEHDAE